MIYVIVIISCILIGYSVFYLLKYLGIDIDLPYCLLFGAMIAPTDPICVVNAMKRTRTPMRIRMIITGESLLNDAAGILLYVIILQVINGEMAQFHFMKILFMLIHQGFGGVVLGYCLGVFVSHFLKRANHDETAILLTLALVTGGYAFATIIDVSGPITMVFAGLVVGHRYNSATVSNNTAEKLHSFWQLIDDILNAFLFVMIGLTVLSVKINILAVCMGALLFIMINLIRFISISLPMFILEPIKSYNWRVMTVMTWGGMRGGLSIALALGMYNALHPSYMTGFLLSASYSVVVLSIVFQGLSIQPLIKKLYPHKTA